MLSRGFSRNWLLLTKAADFSYLLNALGVFHALKASWGFSHDVYNEGSWKLPVIKTGQAFGQKPPLIPVGLINAEGTACWKYSFWTDSLDYLEAQIKLLNRFLRLSRSTLVWIIQLPAMLITPETAKCIFRHSSQEFQIYRPESLLPSLKCFRKLRSEIQHPWAIRQRGLGQ